MTVLNNYQCTAAHLNRAFNVNVLTGLQVWENGLLKPFIYKNDHFTKTGSGQT